MSSSQSERGAAYRYAARICCHVFGYGSLVAGALTFPLVLLSICEVAVGIWKCAVAMRGLLIDTEAKGALHDNHGAVMLVLRGLELLLLSPLPYLILSSLAAFVAEWGYNQNVSEPTFKKIHAAKLLLYGSFFGLLCLDFIGKEISNTMDLQAGIIEIAGLLLLALFIFALERLPTSLGHNPEIKQPIEKGSEVELKRPEIHL